MNDPDVRGCVVNSRDNTERVKTEEKLREGEVRYRALAENGLDLVVVQKPDNTLSYVSPSIKRLLGYEPEEAIGSLGADYIHPEDLEWAWPVFYEQLRTPGINETITLRYKHKNGSWRWFESACNNQLDNPAVGGLVFNCRDVTDRVLAERKLKESEERLRRLNAELVRSNAELEQFSYIVSHDLQAPLRSIDGFSQILLEDHAQGLDERGRDYLGRVGRASQRMGELIDGLLDLSRVTRAELEREVVDLSALAKGVAAELQRSQPERRVTFEIAEGLVAEGDARLLRVVLENLLGNAWKFTGKKGEGARIEFGAERTAEGAAYYVRDDGAGFEMAYAGKLFGAFQRLHGANEFEGTGIGLATVRRVVERHGGRVWAEGAVGEGATFYFTLPEKGGA